MPRRIRLSGIAVRKLINEIGCGRNTLGYCEEAIQSSSPHARSPGMQACNGPSISSAAVAAIADGLGESDLVGFSAEIIGRGSGLWHREGACPERQPGTGGASKGGLKLKAILLPAQSAETRSVAWGLAVVSVCQVHR